MILNLIAMIVGVIRWVLKRYLGFVGDINAKLKGEKTRAEARVEIENVLKQFFEKQDHNKLAHGYHNGDVVGALLGVAVNSILCQKGDICDSINNEIRALEKSVESIEPPYSIMNFTKIDIVKHENVHDVLEIILKEIQRAKSLVGEDVIAQSLAGSIEGASPDEIRKQMTKACRTEIVKSNKTLSGSFNANFSIMDMVLRKELKEHEGIRNLVAEVYDRLISHHIYKSAFEDTEPVTNRNYQESFASFSVLLLAFNFGDFEDVYVCDKLDKLNMMLTETGKFNLSMNRKE